MGGAIRMEESIEGTHARLIFAEANKSAVATEYVRLRHREGEPCLTRIAEDELTRLDRPAVRRGLGVAALDRWLVDAVFVTQRVEVAWLRAVHVKSDGSLEGLEDLQGQLDPEEFIEGRTVLGSVARTAGGLHRRKPDIAPRARGLARNIVEQFQFQHRRHK